MRISENHAESGERMLYFLMSAGILLILCGGYFIKREKQGEQGKGEDFQAVVEEQEQKNGEFIRLLAANQDLKIRLESVEDKLDGISTRLERPGQISEDKTVGPDYGAAACKIAEMKKKNMSVDDMAAALHMGKGEILFIQRLLEK